MSQRPDNWVFLGDSLTEGVGSSRVSFVTELAKQLRPEVSDPRGNSGAVHEIRLRHVDSATFNRFVNFNLAGFCSGDERQSAHSLWLWNLASEGTTVESDSAWLSLIDTLRPKITIIHRGALESIIRPAMVSDQSWPWWIPRAWRGYAAMDPRCYFSTTCWRRYKQNFVDHVNQRVRLHLLKSKPGAPLLDSVELTAHYRTLVERLQPLTQRVVVLGLLPVDDQCFPGSPDYFGQINQRLRRMADETGAEFVDWGKSLAAIAERRELFYRDGFHPNLAGAQTLAKILAPYLSATL